MKVTKAIIPAAGMDLMMGNVEHKVSSNNTHTPFGNVSTLHFDGACRHRGL